MIAGKIPGEIFHLGEFLQLLDALHQPLICVYRDIPLSRTPVHHRVPGSGKIIDPRKIKYNIRVLLRHRPAAVGGSGICHDQLAGDGVPQGL